MTSTLFFSFGVLSTDDAFVPFELLEVPELIEPLDAELQRLGVEDASLDQAHLAPNHVVARRRVAEERDAVDEVLLALLHVERHVDNRGPGLLVVPVGGVRLRRGQLAGARLLVIREIAELELGIGRELEVANRAIQLARLLHALPDSLLLVVRTLLELEDLGERFRLDDFVVRDVDLTDLVARAFADRNAQLDVARLLVAAVFERANLGIVHAYAQISFVAIVPDDLLRVLRVLVLFVGAAAGDEREGPGRLGLLHLPLERAVADLGIADEVDVPNLVLGTVGDVEDEVHHLGSTRNGLDLVGDGAVQISLLRQHGADDALHAPHLAIVDEGVHLDGDVLFLQLLVDLGRFELFRAEILDDLDPLTLLHVVLDQLADHAIGKDVVGDVDREVVEEVRRPELAEVLDQLLLRLSVVGNPDVLGRETRLGADVIEIGRRFDRRHVALLLEAGAHQEDHRSRAGRRQPRGLRNRLPAEGRRIAGGRRCPLRCRNGGLRGVRRRRSGLLGRRRRSPGLSCRRRGRRWGGAAEPAGRVRAAARAGPRPGPPSSPRESTTGNVSSPCARCPAPAFARGIARRRSRFLGERRPNRGTDPRAGCTPLETTSVQDVRRSKPDAGRPRRSLPRQRSGRPGSRRPDRPRARRP